MWKKPVVVHTQMEVLLSCLKGERQGRGGIKEEKVNAPLKNHRLCESYNFLFPLKLNFQSFLFQKGKTNISRKTNKS